MILLSDWVTLLMTFTRYLSESLSHRRKVLRLRIGLLHINTREKTGNVESIFLCLTQVLSVEDLCLTYLSLSLSG